MSFVQDIPVDMVEPNPFETRYTESSLIDELAQSIKSQGQLEPVAARPHPSIRGRYQLIYGHRRLAAIRKIGNSRIRAEIRDADDRSMLQIALVENLQRKDLTDYEKGLLFLRLADEFGMTYEEIGSIVGKSKQLVSNHIAMTRLFAKESLEEDPTLLSLLNEVSESHARVLSRVSSYEERKQLLKLVLTEDLGVRELKSLVGRPRTNTEANLQTEWLNQNIRNKSDNRSDLQSRHGRVCVLRTDSVNYLISKLAISPYQAGKAIAIGAGELLVRQGIDPTDSKNWASILIEKSRYAGWGKISTTTKSTLVIHEPALNAEFVRGYLETLLGIRMRMSKAERKVQVYDIIPASSREQIETVTNRSAKYRNTAV